MAAVLGFCGAADSGKTTLLCRVVSHLSGQGLKVGALKHHGHPEPLALDQPGKDSARLLKAGAARSALVHAGGVSLTAGPAQAQAGPRDLARRLMGDLDLVLVEGYKKADLDKIEVVAPGKEPILPPGGRLLALARRGGAGVEAGLPVLDADDPAQVAGFILDHLAAEAAAARASQDAPPVRLVVDGQELTLKPFVARLVDQTLRGLAGGLKGGQSAEGGRIEVTLG